MWYVIINIGDIILWVISRYNKKKKYEPALTVSMHVDNSGWERQRSKRRIH